ncbi:unnamed protein product [Heligmosomoides polygyrus]|uniref:Arf-GAP domain-containing protein n=1 Tax=Heligmosomoides polygyrus TaxID=6339 RepID=A0A183GE24_HELPZ|nr:unnamed protein product [Heligmosomoides polygyrus]
MDTSAVVLSPTAHVPCVEIVQCADCGADDPQWASINRGVLICNDCCSVHRNLGRQYSQVRSLNRGMWDTPQLELVKLLHKWFFLIVLIVVE